MLSAVCLWCDGRQQLRVVRRRGIIIIIIIIIITYRYHGVNTVPANIMATQTHSPVPLISKDLMVNELLHVLLGTL
jgi:hypothetical protein